MKGSVLVVGDANVDLVVHFPKITEDGQKVEFSTPMLHGGGTGANSAVSLSRLGIPTAFIGSVGDDTYGHYAVRDLQKENVDTEYLFVEPKLHTVCVFAFIDESGERYLWGWPREQQAHRQIPLKRIDLAKVKKASWVHSTGMLLAHESSGRTNTIKLLKIAHQAGVPTSLDLNLRIRQGTLEESYRKAVLEAMQYCTYVFGSGDGEFNYLNSGGLGKESAREFVDSRRSVVVRMGERGSILITTEEEIYEPAFQVEVSDTLGAGDVYNGGFIAARLMDKDYRTALQWGNGVAAYKLKHPGARACPDKGQLHDFMYTHKKRTQQ